MPLKGACFKASEGESAFGNLRRNMGFTRLVLRGMDKVAIETWLLATAMTLKKLAVAEQAIKAANEALYGLEDRCYAVLRPSDT